MVQKHLPLEICNGRLSDNTRALLAKNILERFNRYEKYREPKCNSTKSFSSRHTK